MKYSDKTLNILTAKDFSGIGDSWIRNNITNDIANSVELIVDLLSKKLNKEVINETIFLKRKKIIEKKILLLENCCDGIVSFVEDKFPFCRGEAKPAEKPTVLFYKGDINLLNYNHQNAAVIGLLNPDEHTENDERKIVRKLVENNYVIVSGLAQGCDYIAHHEALLSQGSTVAILPSSLDNILPNKHREFAQDIVDNNGLLITEYFDNPKHKMELSTRYIKRDRLQALFSDVVILSASYSPESSDGDMKIDSGARHAMQKAFDYQIPRAVIYHQDYELQPKYDLNREILSKDRKVIVINPEDNVSSIDAINKIVIPKIKSTDLTLEQKMLF